MKHMMILIFAILSGTLFADEYMIFDGTIDKICGYDEAGCSRTKIELGKDVKISFTLHKQKWFGGKTALVVGPEKMKNTLPKKQHMYYSFALFDSDGRYITGGGDTIDIDISPKEQDGFQSPAIVPKNRLKKIKKYSISLYIYGDDKAK